MNNIKSIKVTNSDGDITVVTDDKEYGEIHWRNHNGELWCAEGTEAKFGEAWTPWVDHVLPNGGDAAMQLENDTATLVRAALALPITMP